MACTYFPKTLTVSERYQVTVDPNWLEGEELTSAVWSTDSDIGISGETIDGGVLTALLTKGLDTGDMKLYIDITTPTRGDKLEFGVRVRDAICI